MANRLAAHYLRLRSALLFSAKVVTRSSCFLIHGIKAAKASLAATASELSDVLPSLAVCTASSGVAFAGAMHVRS